MNTAVSSWDFPRGISGIRVLMKVAQERGIRMDDLLASSGLAPAALTDTDTIIGATQEMTTIGNLVRLTGDPPGLGADVGRRLTIGMLGVWGFAMLLSSTVGDLLDVALRHGHGKLSWIFMRPTLVHLPGAVRLELDGAELRAASHHFILERDLTSTATAIRSIAGRQLPLILETTLPPERQHALRDALPHDVSIHGSQRNAFLFDATALAHPLPMADPLTVEAVERQCAELAVRRARHAGFAGHIRSTLLRSPASMPTLAAIAADHHVDPRTIRRQLSAEGTSFRALRDEVCHRLAVDLLSTGQLTVAQVSHRLGYSDPASFSRAFRRWTGHAPGSAGHRGRRSSVRHGIQRPPHDFGARID